MNGSYRFTLEWIFVKKSKGLCSCDGVPEYWFVSSFLDPERLLLEQNNNWSALGFGFSFRIVPKQPTFVFPGFQVVVGFFLKTMKQFCLCVGVLQPRVSFRKNLNEACVFILLSKYWLKEVGKTLPSLSTRGLFNDDSNLYSWVFKWCHAPFHW